MQSPKAKKQAKELLIHGDLRIDNYYWLNQREDAEVVKYLEEENQYTTHVLKPTEELQEALFTEITSRIKEDDSSVPYLKNGYWYYSRYEKGGEHPIYCRKKGSLESSEEVMLDVNMLAKDHSFYHVAGMSVSPDNRWLAFGEDTVSRRIYTIRFKNLESGEILEYSIEGTTGGVAWSNDNQRLFYTVRDAQTLRSSSVYRFDLVSKEKELVFKESDETFYCHCYKSKSKEFIIIASSSTLTDEYRYLNADEPFTEFQLFQERITGMEYGISHFEDRWYVMTNWEATNFRLMECHLGNTQRSEWKERIPHRTETLLEGIETFKDYLVLEEKTNGLDQIRIINQHDGKEHYLSFDDETYTSWTGVNPEFDTKTLRFGYSSLTRPSSIYDYKMDSRDRMLMKQQEIVGGYEEKDYSSKRIYAKSRDGVDVPISLVYKNETQYENSPLLLYGYGSYGHSMDPYFSSVRLSLLDRGFVFAIAHIRGGQDLGRPWYEHGKLLEKQNTFNDFIDCAEYLKNHKWCKHDSIYAMGGSAGGLLMGAVINQRPDLWKGIIAAVPFVDVVTTMLDESIPLTTGEYDEWGNPNNPEYYFYMKSYSPYDNVKAEEYPAMLVTTGLHDSQVQYWEPAKWVAKLRDVASFRGPLLLHTNMETGHSGASGRFAVHKETALEYAFLLFLENKI